ncbi:P2X purinoceptor 4 [Ixodes scapularis]|uniref:P2X purinoceptor 4 n=1 Tax=Ixodes scapularis TaxID=6945 RepID=UPI001A9CC0CF|nr:P2X purinoceptor 4 [Ixodes scapularis]
MGLGTCMKDTVSYIFEYDTLKVVHISNKKIGALNRLIQLVILGYIVGYVIVYKKGYQQFSSFNTATTTKVKGVLSTQNLSDDDFYPFLSDKSVYKKVWDIADIVVPPEESGQFFVTTNLIITPNQHMKTCPEDPNVKQAHCKSVNDTTSCTPGEALLLGNGVLTGRCVPAPPPNQTLHVCEIAGWCPVEQNYGPLKNGQALFGDVRNFTVLVKNYIEFPLFHVRRSNIQASDNSTYLKYCRYNADSDPLCPVFRLGDIVEEAGVNFEEVAVKGGVIQLLINWDCNLDFDAKYCIPKYTFSRLDDPNAVLAKGWNFRYPKYYDETTRTLVKAYGITFVMLVQGRAGKASPIPIAINMGSGLGLMVVAMVVCDLVVVHCLKRRKLYKAKKYKFVCSDEYYENFSNQSVP